MSLYKNEDLLADAATPAVKQLLGTLPPRWGRMSPLSRLVVLEIVQLLERHGLKRERVEIIGLVGGTCRGSLATDQEFIATMDADSALGSPALFGYTLANVPLGEAAIAAGLTGPVYAIFSEDSPLQQARDEAEILLESMPSLNLMVACSFDHIPADDIFAVSAELVGRNGEVYA